MNGVVALKVDVDTYDGMRYGVPRLLEILATHGVRATFFLSYGPDHSGRAVRRLLRDRSFLQKMWRTNGLRLYGLRTALSGTLLPPRTIASRFPELVRQIAAEGHEVEVHAWNHRFWQDELDRLSRREIENQFRWAFRAHHTILGRRPRAVAAPAWAATATSLRVQDSLDLLYASDLRGPIPCRITLDGYASRTLQIPTTRPCLEELLAIGERDPLTWLERIVGDEGGEWPRVIPLHAEVEGGPYAAFLTDCLERMAQLGFRVRTMAELARDILEGGEVPRLQAIRAAIPGRSGRVLVATGPPLP